jgi:hypothetical protein
MKEQEQLQCFVMLFKLNVRNIVYASYPCLILSIRLPCCNLHLQNQWLYCLLKKLKLPVLEQIWQRYLCANLPGTV